MKKVMLLTFMLVGACATTNPRPVMETSQEEEALPLPLALIPPASETPTEKKPLKKVNHPDYQVIVFGARDLEGQIFNVEGGSKQGTLMIRGGKFVLSLEDKPPETPSPAKPSDKKKTPRSRAKALAAADTGQ